jgi:dihydrofolate reductase
MLVSLIVAMAEHGVIGRGGDLPWRLSADLRRFKQLTMEHHILMGRITYESIGRPLPGRKMIVITRQADFAADTATVVHSLDAAIEAAREVGDDEAFIIGGGEIYQQALEMVDRIYLTRVHVEVDGDTYFPAVDFDRWRLVEEEHIPSDERNEFAHTFQIYTRKPVSPEP